MAINLSREENEETLKLSLLVTMPQQEDVANCLADLKEWETAKEGIPVIEERSSQGKDPKKQQINRQERVGELVLQE